ncbi:MAG: hypothetical protein IK082_09225 [Oscillospiraceae bacterium]|nr:hypothetical protein [Oscillospiraceae bacterium]
MRRVIRATAFLLGLLLAAVLPAAALAEERTGSEPVWDTSRQTAPLRETEEVVLDEPEPGRKGEQNRDTASILEELEILMTMCGTIREALLEGEDQIDLYDLNLTNSCAQFRHIGYFCPYFDGTSINGKLYRYTSGRYTRLELENTLDAEQTAAWIARVDAEVEVLCRMAASSLDPADRALRLHDYMCANYHYDLTLSDYFPGVLATEGSGVCQSYAYLFQYVMLRQGVICYTAESEAMNHAWNIVELNGKTYHMDVTWDDPTLDDYGQARHRYFLLSDDTIGDEDHRHEGWDLTDIVCDDASYENAYMTRAESPVAFRGTIMYYCGWTDEGAALLRFDTATGVETAVASLGMWYISDSSYYPGVWSGLYDYGGLLYYNTSETIRSYDPETGRTAVVLIPDLDEGSLIYGMTGKGSQITWACQSEPDVTYTEKDLRTFTMAYVFGDVDLNGVLNLKDVDLLFRFVTGKTELTEQGKRAADVTKDGKTDMRDVTVLYRTYNDS